MGIAQLLIEVGGVASREVLMRRGATSYALGMAVKRGEIQRIRQAWFAAPGADADLIRAVRVGGALTCISALAAAGVWLRPSTGLHVAVAANASRLRSPDRPGVVLGEDHRDVVVHWNRAAVAITDPRDSIAAALAHMSTCQPTEWTLVALDSALNLKLVTSTVLDTAFAGFPGKSRAILRLTDSGSQSGLETLARYRLRRFGIRHRTQVSIRGVGRVDVLIGDRLVLELDGRAFHSASDAFEADRRRDLALQALGYRVIRLSYHQVMNEWMTCERVIRSMIRRGDHLWPRRRMSHHSG